MVHGSVDVAYIYIYVCMYVCTQDIWVDKHKDRKNDGMIA